MSKPAIVSSRLRSHKLSSPTFERPADVVRWFGAVQAQDYNAARWALGLRMREPSHAVIEEAFNRGEIVRTHLLRPTWHFVAPEDIRWLLKLTAPRVNIRCGPNYRKFELDASVFKRSNRVITNALKGGKHLTRAELKTMLNQSGIAADDTVRLAHILLRAELDGVICSGPRKGKQFTYALLEERVAVTNALTRDESLAELTRRYFTSHGPATLPDFVWWSGLTTDDARRGIALADRELHKASIQATDYWSTAAPAPAAKRSVHKSHLLPAFDEYNVAYKDRQVVFDLDGTSGITIGDALGPTIIVDGRIVGLWKATAGKDSVAVAVNPARALNKQEKLAITKAAERYATFLNLTLDSC